VFPQTAIPFSVIYIATYACSQPAAPAKVKQLSSLELIQYGIKIIHNINTQIYCHGMHVFWFEFQTCMQPQHDTNLLMAYIQSYTIRLTSPCNLLTSGQKQLIVQEVPLMHRQQWIRVTFREWGHPVGQYKSIDTLTSKCRITLKSYYMGQFVQ